MAGESSLYPYMIGAGAGAGGFFGSLFQQDRSYDIFRTQRRDWREHMRTLHAREDSAAQRRVEDLRAAGLSPTLAAGSPASASPGSAPPGYSLPETSPVEKGLANAMNLMTMQADISKTFAEAKHIDKQSIKTDLESEILTIERNVAENTSTYKVRKAAAEMSKSEYDARLKAVDLKIKNVKYDRELLAKMLDALKAKFARTGISKMEVEILHKEAAIELLATQNREALHNINWFEKFGIPSKGLDQFSRSAAFIFKQIEEMAERAKKANKPRQGSSPTEAYNRVLDPLKEWRSR